MRFRKWKNCTVIANEATRAVYLASYDFDYDGTSQALGNNLFMGNDGDFGYVMPTNTATLSAIKFVNSGGNKIGQNITGKAGQFLNPFTTFAGLPGQPGVTQKGPFLGQEFVITDGNSSTFRGVVGGGGSTNVKVRWNGSNWIACG